MANMIRGTKVDLAGETFEIPPLNFDAIERFEDQLRGLGTLAAVPTREQRGVLRGVVLAAIQRNYPDMTLDKLKQGMDLGNMMTVFKAVISVSSMEEAKPGEA